METIGWLQPVSAGRRVMRVQTKACLIEMHINIILTLFSAVGCFDEGLRPLLQGPLFLSEAQAQGGLAHPSASISMRPPTERRGSGG